MKKEDIFLMFIIIIGVVIINIPSFFDVASVKSVGSATPFYGYIGIFYVPVGLSLSNVLMRKMKGLHFVQLAVFKTFISIPVVGGIIALQNPSW